jgi:lysophospholipase L1-like esterase
MKMILPSLFLSAVLMTSSCNKTIVQSEEYICTVTSGVAKDSTSNATNTGNTNSTGNSNTNNTNTNNNTTTQEKDVLSPKFSLENGKYKFGTEITLSAEPGTDIQYSWDEGKTWTKGNKTLIRRTSCLFAKATNGKKESAVAKAEYKVFFEKVLFVGNSITVHGPLAGSDWNNDWGMAATAPDKDYVSLVNKKLYEANPNTKFQRYNAASFERDFLNYNYERNASFFRDFDADLIVIRLGENADNTFAFNNNFERHIKQLVDYLRKGRTVRVVVTNCFWRRNDLVAFKLGEFVRIANEAGLEYDFADISKLELDPSNTAVGIFKSQFVAEHPSDKGMKAIADAIIQQLKL